MWRAICVVGLIGCGRLDFDASAVPSSRDGAVAADGGPGVDAASNAGPDGAAPDGVGPDGAGPDGAPAWVPTCPVRSTAPDPLTLSGHVVEILTDQLEAAVDFEISTSAAGSVVTTAVSDAAGNFTFTIPTGGLPVLPFIKSSKPGLLTDYDESNQPFDGDESGLVI